MAIYDEEIFEENAIEKIRQALQREGIAQNVSDWYPTDPVDVDEWSSTDGRIVGASQTWTIEFKDGTKVFTGVSLNNGRMGMPVRVITEDGDDFPFTKAGIQKATQMAKEV